MRRLRENTMLEAEISPAGAVLVEGHHVGELQGFRFTADQSAGGEDAKAVEGRRAEGAGRRVSRRAPTASRRRANGDIALGSDGTLRWIGAPIATLVAGDDALRPRFVLLADEQLTGAARDKVAARAERFVNYQIDTLLKPLVDLKAAEHDPRHRPRHRLPAGREFRHPRTAATSPRTSSRSTRTAAPRCAGSACASAPTTSSFRRC